MIDVITKVDNPEIQCLDKGFVRIVDVMPRLVSDERGTADEAIVASARVSYGAGTKSISDDRSLIRYLMRNSHMTPFEAVSIKYHMKLPQFVSKQIIRHRTAHVNEQSARYSQMADEFYIPDPSDVRQQSTANKQSSDISSDICIGNQFTANLQASCDNAYDEYSYQLSRNVCREQARMLLPVNLYTEWYWGCDLRNLLHFLALRCDHHAQKETRIYAEAMLKLIEPIVPMAIEAWNDYHELRGAIKLSALETAALSNIQSNKTVPQIASGNKRERNEWVVKAKKLGFEVVENAY